MIERDIPRDIRKYESKFIGPFTLRQSICFGIASVLGVGAYLLQRSIWPDSEPSFMVSFILGTPPILFGWLKPQGMKLEEFIKSVFVTTVLSPRNRIYKTNNYFEQCLDKPKNTKKQKKKVKKTEIEYMSYK